MHIYNIYALMVITIMALYIKFIISYIFLNFIHTHTYIYIYIYIYIHTYIYISYINIESYFVEVASKNLNS